MRTAVRRGGSARPGGFSIVELMIVVAIIGIVAAIAMAVYFGYARDARSSEAKTLAGSVFKALEACAQGRGSGGSCGLADITTKVGISPAGLTGDGRWSVGSADLAMSASPGTPTFNGTIAVAGVAGRDSDRMALGMYIASTGVTLRCTSSSLVPPSSAAGDAC